MIVFVFWGSLPQSWLGRDDLVILNLWQVERKEATERDRFDRARKIARCMFYPQCQ